MTARARVSGCSTPLVLCSSISRVVRARTCADLKLHRRRRRLIEDCMQLAPALVIRILRSASERRGRVVPSAIGSERTGGVLGLDGGGGACDRRVQRPRLTTRAAHVVTLHDKAMHGQAAGAAAVAVILIKVQRRVLRKLAACVERHLRDLWLHLRVRILRDRGRSPHTTRAHRRILTRRLRWHAA